MKSFFRQIPRPPLIIVIVLLAAAILLACGPATQSAPGEQPGSSPAKEKPTPEPTNTPEPTPPPTDIVTTNPDGSTNEIVQWVPPKSPPKYPEMDSILEGLVKELEEAEDLAAGGISGASGPRQAIEAPIVDVDVYLTANILTVVEWLKSKGVTPVNVYEYEDGSGGGGFNALVPLSLLGELATQEGIREIQHPRPISVDKE